MGKRKTFMDRYLAGKISDPETELYEELAAWHELRSTDLPAWLGMTYEEYSLWVRKPSSLPAILNARRGMEQRYRM